MKKLVSITFMVFLSMLLVACEGYDLIEPTDPTDPTDPTPPVVEIEDYNYYDQTVLNEDKHIYVLNSLGVEDLDNDQSFTAQAIQGLFARDRVTFYFDGRSVTNMVNTDRHHLDVTIEAYDLTTEDVTLEEAVEMYINAWDDYVSGGLWGSQIPLTDFNNIPGLDAYTETSGEGYATPGYIIYRKGTVSVNVAATLAGITGFLPVELSQVATYEAMGLTEKFNVDNIVFDYRWVFENILFEVNPDGLIHQDYQSPGGNTNVFLKDYGITQKYMYVYYDSQVNAPTSFKTSLHQFLTPNRPILGYAYSEDQDVEFFSRYGQFIVPTDYSFNISYLLAETFRKDDNGELITFEQPNDISVETADPNKHYVAFVVSDGDNATMWQNTAPFAPNFMQAVGRENDDFPVTWSITPSMADLMPSILEDIYNNVSNPYDTFAAPVSGHGYINAGSFLEASDGEYFADYLSRLNVYLNKSDLGVVTIIGAQDLNQRIETIERYAEVDNLTGGIVYDGNKYFGNIRGGVYWANDKPFVGPRDSLWETTPEFIAARLNMYPADPTTIDGYSIINVHPWSHSYEDIRTIVNMLSDQVEVVSVDTLYHLMTNHITNQTNGEGFKTPDLNGVSITQAELESNPSLIPVNPLYNDFILWEEDWQATSGTISYANNDVANSNVGTFLTSLSISGNSKATKEPFTLPNIDDIWISFVARANSTNPEDVSRFKITMTVSGETKTIVEEAAFRGVSGTGTASNIDGDGWQYIAFPVGQYFDNYKDLEAQVSIEVLNDIGLKVDKFEIAQKVATPTGDFDAYNNQFLEGNTEDWLLGHMFLTSQYFYWGAVDKNTGQPFGAGAISTDTSDGGGDEKRNANTNLWMAKQVVLPSTEDIIITHDIDGGDDTGASYKLSLYVDGQMYVLQDWNRVIGNTDPLSIDLSELFPGVDFNAKEATFVIEIRDSGVNNGVGESMYFNTFQITTKQ